MLQRKYSILLVDDEEITRQIIAQHLARVGYLVTVAENGLIALNMMQVEHFDLILLDMNMPVMDGLATLDAIKSNPVMQKTAVVMLTASNAREHVVHCLTLGAADYLIKPVNLEELRQRVRHCLDNKTTRIEPTVHIESKDITGARVLIVDDEPINLKLLANQLRKVGFGVLAAASGLDALELLGRENVDAILLDVNMPHMDGKEVLTAIRASEQWRILPVLMLSFDDEQETVEHCYQLGANDYWSNLTILMTCICGLLYP